MKKKPTLSLTLKISRTIVAMAASVMIVNTFDAVVLQRGAWLDVLATPQVWSLFLMTVFFGLSRFLPEKLVQITQITLIVFLSGPMTLPSAFTFFGMWFYVLGVILLYKYGFLRRWAVTKVLAVSVYFLPFLVLSVMNNEGLSHSGARVVGYVIFLLSCLVFLYVLFEQPIRDLVSSAGQKEADLAEKSSQLARMEPLSLLGERVSHVTHSFKNHLSQLDTIANQLETSNDAQQGATRLKEVNADLRERIENILMVSRAGADLEPETFDAARVLEGLKFVYLSEPTFAQHVWHEMTLRGPQVIRAVRWDFILMIENILKNALDAIRTRNSRGIVRIELSGGLLTIANNGGAMEFCSACTGYCLDCQVYGRGRPTSRGAGQGLSQVFSTCRKNGWGLRIRTDQEWTIFQILLVVGSSPEVSKAMV